MQIPIEGPTGPVDPPTTPTTPAPPFSGGLGDPGAMIWVVIIIGLIAAFVLSFRYYRGSFKIEGKDVRPSLKDLDSNQHVLNQFLMVQGGMAIIITFGIIFSMQWILTMPQLTLTSSGSFIGIAVAARSWVKDYVREGYNNRSNLEGYMRDKKGTKRRYSWSNIDIQTEYIMDESMIREIEEQTKDMKDEKGKSLAWDQEKLKEVKSTPIDLDGKYTVVLLSTNGKLDIEWVEWWDLDMFGDYSTPSAGPELRHISTVHIVTEDPLNPFYGRNEYVHVFAVIVDDGLTRDAVKTLSAIDVEKNHLHIGLLKVVGVERKVTAGEANTDRAAWIDELNTRIDFDDIVESTAALKAIKYAEDKERVGNLKRMQRDTNPNVIVIAFMFVVGILLGYTWGQNSILSQIYATGIVPWIPHISLVIYSAASKFKLGW